MKERCSSLARKVKEKWYLFLAIDETRQ